MRAVCPNCGTGIDSAATACYKCAALFTGEWKPVVAGGGAFGQAGGQASGQAHGRADAAQVLAVMAGLASLLAWVWCLVFAYVGRANLFGLQVSYWRSFNNHLRYDMVPLPLALLAMLLALGILVFTRARVVPRKTILSSLVFIMLAAPTLSAHPLVRPLLEKAGLIEARKLPHFLPMNDGRWWDCGAVMRKLVCEKDAAPALARLNAQEKDFLARLEALPAPPAALTQAQVRALFTQAPTRSTELGPLTVLDWPGMTPGREAQGKIAVSIAYGQLYEIQWIEPERFFLQKINEVKQETAGR